MEFPAASELHAILVHFPIALAIIGVPLVLAVALTASDRLALRWASVATYLVVAASAYAAFWSGDRARELIPNTYPGAIWTLLETHEAMAATVWIGALITAALLLIGGVRFTWVRIPATTIAFVTSLITAVLVGITAHFGGQLVYKHSIGTPGAAAIYAAPTTLVPAMPQGPEAPLAIDPLPVQPNTATLAPSLGPAPAPVVAAIVPAPVAVAEAEPTPAIRPIVMAEAQAVSYLLDVAPIMEAHCNECHYEGEAEGDLVLTSVPDMIAGGQKAGASIIPGDPDSSPLIQYIRGMLKPQMPKRKPPLSDDELHVLRSWIQAGAVDDSAPKP